MQVELNSYATGAAIATDLVNTAAEVQVSTGDTLADPAALERFLAEHDLARDALTWDDVAAVRDLRQTLRDLIEAADHAGIGELAQRVGRGPLLRADGDGGWEWCVGGRPDAGVADDLALLTSTGLLGVFRALGPDRFRSCASPVCAGVFVDSSRSGRRRYCNPAVCGNRINVARHRARRRAG